MNSQLGQRLPSHSELQASEVPLCLSGARQKFSRSAVTGRQQKASASWSLTYTVRRLVRRLLLRRWRSIRRLRRRVAGRVLLLLLPRRVHLLARRRRIVTAAAAARWRVITAAATAARWWVVTAAAVVPAAVARRGGVRAGKRLPAGRARRPVRRRQPRGAVGGRRVGLCHLHADREFADLQPIHRQRRASAAAMGRCGPHERPFRSLCIRWCAHESCSANGRCHAGTVADACTCSPGIGKFNKGEDCRMAGLPACKCGVTSERAVVGWSRSAGGVPIATG